MLTIETAIDLFVGDLRRRGYSKRTADTYSRILNRFADRLPAQLDVARITPDDVRRYLDRYNRHAPGTRAHAYSVLSSFFKWLEDTERIKRAPTRTIGRPKRQRPEDLDVVEVTADDVRALLAAARTWTEKLTVAIPAYIGPRRRAIATLRLRDYNRPRGLLRFHEKGGKTIWKPVPVELASLIEAAIADGAIVEPDDYLVPPEGQLVRGGDRDDRVIWRVLRRVADRAGVHATVHSLRAAFAVFYLEANPGDLHGLRELMGHSAFQTTQVYLRKLDKVQAMSRVRSLSWLGSDAGEAANSGLAASTVVGAGGFEPPLQGSPLSESDDPQHSAPDLAGDLHERARYVAGRPDDAPTSVDSKSTEGSTSS
jgi:integrase